MKKSNKIILIVATILGVGVIYLIVKNNQLGKRIISLESDNLRLQKFLFSKYSKNKDAVISEIDNLILQFQKNNPETVKNLQRAKELYIEGHGEEAVKKLVVIIENKIKLKFENEKDTWYIAKSEKKKKFMKLTELFDRAKEISFFNELQFSLANLAAGIRHGESHREGFEDKKTKVQMSILSSIEIIGMLVPINQTVLSPVKVNQKMLLQA